MKNKIAFLTVVFPMDFGHLINFFDSLDGQTYKNFDVVVVNDEYVGFQNIIQRYSNLNIIELKFSSTHAKNREFGINYIIRNNYNILVFGDSDDYFKSNRIEVSVDKLLEYDVVVNDLSLFNNNTFVRRYISNRINNNSEIYIEFIEKKNIFGMSNSAIKLGKLKEIEFNKELVAVDWYFFSTLLIKGYKAVFTNETETFYRQHDENIIGIGNITDEIIEKGVNLKLEQYELLVIKDVRYKKLLIDMKVLKNNMKDKEIIIEKNIEFPLWWEEIDLI